MLIDAGTNLVLKRLPAFYDLLIYKEVIRLNEFDDVRQPICYYFYLHKVKPVIN